MTMPIHCQSSAIVVLAFHIWWVMRPRVDAATRIMARIDIHQPILPADAGRIRRELAYSSAARVIPVESEMAMGCPVAASSFAYKAYKFMTHIF